MYFVSEMNEGLIQSAAQYKVSFRTSIIIEVCHYSIALGLRAAYNTFELLGGWAIVKKRKSFDFPLSEVQSQKKSSCLNLLKIYYESRH